MPSAVEGGEVDVACPRNTRKDYEAETEQQQDRLDD
jgi:hypothetical protein